MFTEFLAQGNKMKLHNSMKRPEIRKTRNAAACLLVSLRGPMPIFSAVQYDVDDDNDENVKCRFLFTME